MRLVSIICLAFITSYTSSYAASCPSLSGTAAQDACDEFETIYGSYAEALSRHFGRAMGLATHVNYPLGEDNMGKFPKIYVGTGIGAALTNTNAIKNESDPEVTSSAIPSVLPAPTFSLNLGVGITERLDIRLSFLPLVKIQIPQTSSTSDLSGTVTIGTAKLKAGYNILKSGKTFSPGITISGFFTWNQGKIDLTSGTLTTENRTSSSGTAVVNKFTYVASSQAKWLFFGAGSEIRVWYDMLFFFPYVGYGFGFQGGRFRTTVTLDGTIEVTPTASATQTSAVSTGPDRSAVLPAVLQRIFLGFEFHIFAVRIGTEVQFAFGSQLAAISVGAGMQF